MVPHFEKMADDNAWLLRNYLDAYAVYGDERYREVARGITRFFREVLSDPAGGFFASQDADVTPDDEGGYFIWSERELQDILTIEEFEVLSLHLFSERGRLHHDPEKRVLSLAMTLREVAGQLSMSEEAVRRLIDGANAKLRAARNRRPAPFVDRSLYTSLNGMCITSFLKAYRILGDSELRDFALASLDRILRERFREGRPEHAEGVPALLDDLVFLVEALVAAYEATGDRSRLERAEQIMDRCRETFGDPAGGFFDTGDAVLGVRLKRIEDIPHPSANAVAALQLIKLWHITGKERYRDEAERTLAIFAGAAPGMGIHGGMYFCAVDAWFSTLALTVEARPGSELAAAAMRLAGAATVLVYGEDRGRVIACMNEVCREPVTSAAGLRTIGPLLR
jgi:uncharacterized protein YyaL (SSP411 family)